MLVLGRNGRSVESARGNATGSIRVGIQSSASLNLYITSLSTSDPVLTDYSEAIRLPTNYPVRLQSEYRQRSKSIDVVLKGKRPKWMQENVLQSREIHDPSSCTTCPFCKRGIANLSVAHIDSSNDLHGNAQVCSEIRDRHRRGPDGGVASCFGYIKLGSYQTRDYKSLSPRFGILRPIEDRTSPRRGV